MYWQLELDLARLEQALGLLGLGLERLVLVSRRQVELPGISISESNQ